MGERLQGADVRGPGTRGRRAGPTPAGAACEDGACWQALAREHDAAIAHPRVHCQGGPTFIDARIGPDVAAALARMGHDVVPVEENPATWHFGRVCAVEVGDHVVHASAGPVWTTAAAAV